MENQNNAEMQTKDTSKRTVFIVIILILFATNLLLIWQYFEKKSNLAVVSESLKTSLMDKDQLNAELQKVKLEYEKTNLANGELQSLLSSKDEEIKSKISQIQKLISSGDDVSLKKAKIEIDELKVLNVRYSMGIDSLKNINLQLAKQNQNLNTNLAEVQGQVNSLTQQNTVLSSKVAVGSILKIQDFFASAIRNKNNGKEIIVTKASTAEQIKIVFTIQENLVVDKGNKDIYIRIVSPGGSVLATSQETFLVNGQASLYTQKEVVAYQNQDTEITTYYPKSIPFIKGKYEVELYNNNNKIGTANFTLK